MDYEVIVKYNGDITFLEQEQSVSVELLGYNYAIITADTPQKVDNLLNYTQIEYVEKPFILETQDTQSFSSTGITSFKERTKLTGKGTYLYSKIKMANLKYFTIGTNLLTEIHQMGLKKEHYILMKI